MLIRICMHCKKKYGFKFCSPWFAITPSHGVCIDCLKKLYPDVYKKMKKAGKI